MVGDVISLKLAPISFYSKGDERCLWRGLQHIPFVSDLQFIDAGCSFSVNTAMVDWSGFKDLMAIYIRYRGDLKDLLPICPEGEVREWFLDPQRDWHRQLR
jgi:hypothetical protein